MTNHLYVATWHTLPAQEHQQVFGGDRGLFYAVEAMRKLGGQVVDQDEHRVLLDMALGIDDGPRCDRDECQRHCVDTSAHAPWAINAWEHAKEATRP